MELADRMKRVAVTEQDPVERAKNFKEVCLGYDNERAVKEASRCLHCKNPKCVEGCPVSINIPEFISHIKENDIDDIIKSLDVSCVIYTNEQEEKINNILSDVFKVNVDKLDFNKLEVIDNYKEYNNNSVRSKR